METSILVYALKASIVSTLLYGLYVLMLKNDTFNRAKRFYLLSVLLFSVIYPFCTLNIATSNAMATYGVVLPTIEITDTLGNNQPFFVDIVKVLFLTLVGGVVVLLVRLLIRLFIIVHLRIRNKSQNILNHRVINLEKPIVPFSFFSWIFVSADTFEAGDLSVILSHEEEHIKQWHSVDMLVGELYSILFWWNPIAWLLRKEIKTNLEYLADNGVLNKGIDAKKYQYLLLKVVTCNTNVQLVNNFNVLQLKKRIAMINKTKTSALMSCKYLVALPLIGFMLLANSPQVFSKGEKTTSTKTTDGTPYEKVEVMPQFPGGEGAMMQYIGQSMKYPESAAKEKIEGMVVVRFVVAKTGEVKDATIVRSAETSLDNEALRVVRSMPTWTPGKEKGENVDVYYTLPLLFKLQK